jgi:hypothetical protein
VTYRAAELEQAFAEHIRAVSEALARVGAEYMLIGGLAVGVWVEPRATKDADLSVRVLAPVNTLKGALAKAGLEVVRGDLARAVERGEVVRLRRGAPSGTPIVIDLLFATTPFEIEALARRRPLRVLGVDVPVTTPEDLFIFKLIARRPQDLADAHQLYEVHGETFDVARVRRWCRDFGAEERVEALTRSTPREP